MVHNNGKNEPKNKKNISTARVDTTSTDRITGRPPACGMDGCWMREEGVSFFLSLTQKKLARTTKRQILPKNKKRWRGADGRIAFFQIQDFHDPACPISVIIWMMTVFDWSTVLFFRKICFFSQVPSSLPP